jgi:catechol 2,3-dioxygenase-like lactoylglutathione lyase family enzyme
MTPAGILETSLYADDLVAAEAFYAGVLGLPVYARAAGRHLFLTCGDQMLLLFAPSETEKPAAAAKFGVPPHGARGPGHVCFRASAAAIETWRVHLTAHGVAIEAEVTWPGGGRSIYFRDPAGNSLEFAEPRIWKFA